MQRYLCATALLVLSAVAHAGNTTSSSANTESSATSAAQNAGNAQNINFNSRNDGTSTLHAAPALSGQGFYGSFSPDGCMVSGGGGFSVLPGVAANVATPIKDEHCMALRAYERTMQGAASEPDARVAGALRQAGRDILCQSSDTTRRAYTLAGLCSPEFAEQPADPADRAAQVRAARQRAQLAEVYGSGG